MDYPAGFKEESQRMLEQVIATGPKCGVFTVILRNSDQIGKADSRVAPLIDNIETENTTCFDIMNGQIICVNQDAVFQKRNILFSFKG